MAVPAEGSSLVAVRRADAPRAVPTSRPGSRGGRTPIRPRRASFFGIAFTQRPRTTPTHSPACRTGPTHSLPCRRRSGSHFRCSRRTTRWHRGFPSNARSPSPHDRHTPTEPPREATVGPHQAGIQPRRDSWHCSQLTDSTGRSALLGTIRRLEVARILPITASQRAWVQGVSNIQKPESIDTRCRSPSIGTALLHPPRPHPENSGRDPAKALDDVADLERTPGTMQSILSHSDAQVGGMPCWRG